MKIKEKKSPKLTLRLTRQEGPMSKKKIFCVVVEGKGGVGKSVAAQVAHAALGARGENVFIGETDSTNSVMATIHGNAGAEMIDLSRVEAEGHFYEIAENLAAGDYDHVVVDTGARDEATLRPFLPALASQLAADGIGTSIIRPMVLAHFVQVNAYSFVKAVKNDHMGVVLLNNLSQGRKAVDFDDWLATEMYKTMIATPGVVACDLLDAGVCNSDNVTSFKMTLVDAAACDFTKAGNDEALARTVINRRIQLFLQKWLLRQIDILRPAIFSSVGYFE